MILNIISGNFGLVKSWQRNPRPIGVSVLFVPFWSHSNPYTKAQLECPKRLTQLDNQLDTKGETYRILYDTKKVNEMVCMWVLDTLLFSLEHIHINWLRDHISWASSGIGGKIKSVLEYF